MRTIHTLTSRVRPVLFRHPKDAASTVVSDVNSKLWLAPVGTVMPADHATALNAAFIDMGYLKEPPSVEPGRSTKSLDAWNSGGRPIRNVLETDAVIIKAMLLQTTTETLKLAFRGGTAVVAGTGIKFTPGTTDQERAMVLEITDGTKVYRELYRRVAVDTIGARSWPDDEMQVWEMSFEVLEPSSGAAFEILTNIAGVVVG